MGPVALDSQETKDHAYSGFGRRALVDFSEIKNKVGLVSRKQNRLEQNRPDWASGKKWLSRGLPMRRNKPVWNKTDPTGHRERNGYPGGSRWYFDARLVALDSQNAEDRACGGFMRIARLDFPEIKSKVGLAETTQTRLEQNRPDWASGKKWLSRGLPVVF
ncbi:hypothetical protein CRG98_031485 [Punica granatum]|uniref:Uncharacterized protein n=1 Tax=Punica granatum TaxID=22663 RepID=A0A2I0IWJ7_PUNGR|nr:hypothetical protein CRG98_031485 [Punica granatum]